MKSTATQQSLPEQRSITTQADVAALVLAEPATIWRGTEIAERTEHRLVDVMVALAVMTGEGRIERVAAGSYRAPTATPSELIAQLDKELFRATPNP